MDAHIYLLMAAMFVVPNQTSVLKQKEQFALHEGLAEAFLRLDRQRCAEIFVPTAKTALTNATFRFVSLGRPAYRAGGLLSVITATTIKISNSVFINRDGPFLETGMSVRTASSVFVNFNLGLNPAEFRALILLHELGHLVGTFKPDATDSELTAQYTKLVRDRCFP